VTKDQREVCSVSRGVMLSGKTQPLFAPLQSDIRFLPPPLPAAPRAYLAARFPPKGEGETTGLPRSVSLSEWVGLCLSAGGASSAAEDFPPPAPGHLPFGFKPPLQCFQSSKHLSACH